MDRDIDVPEGKLPGGYTKDNVERTAKMVCDCNVCAWVLVWAFQGVEWPHMYSERIDQELAKAVLEQNQAASWFLPTTPS
jgi:hypothetical protein